jgi:transposase
MTGRYWPRSCTSPRRAVRGWKLPGALFGVSRATAHRRFAEWTRAGLWERMHQVILDRLGSGGFIDWSRAIVDSISVRAERGELTGPSPVDRGKPGSKIHVLVDRTGLALTLLTSAANTHDSLLLIPLVDAVAPTRVPRGRPRHRPTKLHADKALTSERYAPSYAVAASSRVSPVRAWSPPPAWVVIAGSSRRAWPGCYATVAWSAATSASPSFDAVLADLGVDVVLSGVRMPRMNAVMERWVQTCSRELLDRTLIGTRRTCCTPCASSSPSTTGTGPTRASPMPDRCARCPHRSQTPASSLIYASTDVTVRKLGRGQ